MSQTNAALGRSWDQLKQTANSIKNSAQQTATSIGRAADARAASVVSHNTTIATTVAQQKSEAAIRQAEQHAQHGIDQTSQAATLGSGLEQADVEVQEMYGIYPVRSQPRTGNGGHCPTCKSSKPHVKRCTGGRQRTATQKKKSSKSKRRTQRR
jgi:hypothetical protein